jgi:glutathione S-transferase
MAPILYHVPKTISSPIVQCLLELDVLNNPVEVKEISFGELKSPEYLLINPMGTAPAFQDESIILWESGAVLSYLLECYDTEQKLSPSRISSNSTTERLASRAKYMHLKQYIIATVYPFISALYIHTLKPENEQDTEYVRFAKKKWITLFGPVLTKWLGDGPYFLGSHFSAVDFLVAKPLNNVNSMGMLTDFPALQKLFESISSRPSFKAAYEGMPQQTYEPYRSLLLVPNKEDCTLAACDMIPQLNCGLFAVLD